MRDVLLRLELLAAWLKPGGEHPGEPIPDKYSTLVEAISEIKRLRRLSQSSGIRKSET